MALPLRAWGATRRLGSFRGQARVAAALARRYASADRFQIGGDGFALRIDPTDHFQALMLLGLFERSLIDCVTQYTRPGSVFMDCGANMGYIALHAARTVGPGGSVEAFECDPRVAAKLRDHARLNQVPINVRELAVWKESGPIAFHVSDQPGWSSLQDGEAGSGGQDTEVMAVTLDEHLASVGIDPAQVSMIKLDVEGAEPEALEGSIRLLSEGSPALVIEIDPERSARLGKDPDGLFRRLDELGYRAAELVGERSPDPRADALRKPGPTDVVFIKR
jgi:FkbM family methyltransferase